MIVTVTLNASWDVTYPVDALRPGHGHRVLEVDGRAGGKGVNAARVLHHLGQPCRAVVAVGGPSGAAVLRELAGAGIPHTAIEAGAPSRQTVTVVDRERGEATVFSEPGPSTLDWTRLRTEISAAMRGAAVVLLAGSLPPGLPVSAYRDLVVDAHSAGALVVLDADGAALQATLAAGPNLVKPNVDELARAAPGASAVAGVRALVAAGAVRVVVSDGARGLWTLDGDTVVRAVPPSTTVINATGAGDAAAAALSIGLRAGVSLTDLLTEAAAVSCCAVLAPAAGDLAVDQLPAVRRAVTIESRTVRAARRARG